MVKTGYFTERPLIVLQCRMKFSNRELPKGSVVFSWENFSLIIFYFYFIVKADEKS
jgi:hypothetical protein